ncbi:uncharacterized protein LOC125543902 [Triticum urartu]|uniref:uncharacterized protein LOC125543902 n=1 Tax=Triticum urartu TaxID=4572 RepID=UPI002042EFF6|nr:uncharacterized protein LOC125543902 [Triticum urartu]
MAPVVTAALGALGPLLGKLADLLAGECSRLKGVRREIRSLQSEFKVTMHVKEVIDRGPFLTEGLADELLPDEDVDLSRKHTFTTWRGKIDGTGPGPYGNA